MARKVNECTVPGPPPPPRTFEAAPEDLEGGRAWTAGRIVHVNGLVTGVASICHHTSPAQRLTRWAACRAVLVYQGPTTPLGGCRQALGEGGEARSVLRWHDGRHITPP